MPHYFTKTYPYTRAGARTRKAHATYRCGKWGISMFHGENRNDCKGLRCPTPVGHGFMFHGDLFNGVGGLALPHHSGARWGRLARSSRRAYHRRMIAGVDIGQRGGVAVFDGETWQTWQAQPKRAPLWRCAKEARASCAVSSWYVERPLLLQSHGRASSHAIGVELGRLDVALDGVRRFDVDPRRWQSALGLASRRTGRASHKARLKAAAEEIAGFELGEGEADAVLLAWYGWQLRNGANA